MRSEIKWEIILKRRLKILTNPSQIDPKMVPNSWKLDFWSCLGALWAPSWRQDGPRATPKSKNRKKYIILVWPMGSKIKLKSIKTLMKNRLDFCNDFETTFSRSWIDFGSKIVSQIRGGSLFQPRCEYARSVILNNPPIVLPYLSTLEASIFDLKMYICQLFVRKRF